MSTSEKQSYSLPSFSNPPIDEVICGMRFNKPDDLKIPHVGLIWEKFRDYYPNIQHAIPITKDDGELPVDQTGLPITRVWFINKSDDQLVQFQFDQFYFNWRKRKEEYPRYTSVFGNFWNTYKTMDKCFNDFGFEKLSPTLYELTYANHIPKGQGWETAGDFGKLFRDFSLEVDEKRFLPEPEMFLGHVEFKLPEKMGFLGIDFKQGLRSRDNMPVIILRLTAKGFIEPHDDKTMKKWFDTAHEWIVRGFDDFTTPNAHSIWGKEYG